MLHFLYRSQAEKKLTPRNKKDYPPLIKRIRLQMLKHSISNR